MAQGQEGRIDHLVQIDTFERHGGFADPRVIQKRVDQAIHPLRELEDGGNLLPPLIIQNIPLSALQRGREMVDAVQMILEIMRSGMGEAVEIGMGGLKLPAYAVDLPRPSEDDIANGKAQPE